MDREIIFEKVRKPASLHLNAIRVTLPANHGSVHASEIGWSWQNIQDYICHKSEGVF